MKYLIILGLCIICSNCSRPEKQEITPQEQEQLDTPPNMVRVFKYEF